MKIEGPDWILAAVVMFMVFCFGVIVGDLHGQHNARLQLHKEVIEHHAAEYVCDPATGETVFRWKEQK